MTGFQSDIWCVKFSSYATVRPWNLQVGFSTGFLYHRRFGVQGLGYIATFVVVVRKDIRPHREQINKPRTEQGIGNSETRHIL